MAEVVLGTANLYGAVDPPTSAAVLRAGWEAGIRAVDTAPSYGHGRSEVEVGRFVAGRTPRPTVITKVGLEPTPPDSAAKRGLKSAARRLPGPLQQRLRPGGGEVHGSFELGAVRASVERSLERLGHIDRLMLHEVAPDDVTPELVALLEEFRDRGDVGVVGVATGNATTAACVARAPQLLTAVHIAAGPFASSVLLPATVTTVVGHGLFGAGGADLRRLRELPADVAEVRRWHDVAGGTRWDGPGGLTDALVARAAVGPLTGVIVATSRPTRLAGLPELAGGEVVLPPDVAAALAGLVSRCGG